MSLPIYQTQNKDILILQTQWSSQINPVINAPIVKGNLLNNISLVVGNNTINHKLSRKYQGWIVIGMHNSFVQLYDVVSTTPEITLILNSSAVGSIDLYVF